MRLPLDDIRVIDLTVARAGPTCVRQLADWGADVVHVDVPSDPSRPGIVGEARHGSDFQYVHRNKRSVSLDLKSPDGLDLLLELIDGADVVVENMRPGVKHRLGFDPATVRARNPRVVYGSISGFGQDGPYADRGGVDQIIQGMSGLMSVTGPPGSGPNRVGIPVSDLAAGLFLAIGILTALHDRRRTGVGAYVHTSLLESMLAMLDFQSARWTVEGVVAGQEGNHHPSLVPMGCFESADGYVNIAGPSGRLLRNFCDVIGRPDLLGDARFDSAAKRHQHRSELNGIIADVLRTRTTAEWVAACTAAGVPCGPVNRIDEAFADPQVEHLGMTATLEHATLGSLSFVRNPVTIASDGPDADGPIDTVRRPSPDPGEHTDELLADLGVDPARIADLRARGIV